MTAVAGVAALLSTARHHHQQGRLAEAEAGYRQILTADPTQAEALHRLGVLAVQMGKPETAITLLAWSLRHNPTDVVACTNLSITLRQLGRQDEAERAGRAAIAIDASFAEAHAALADALIDRQAFAEAVEPLARHVALRPDSTHHRLQLAHALIRCRRFAEAEILLRDLVRRTPDDVRALANLGVALKNLGRYDEALSAYGIALCLDPANAAILNNMGLTLAQKQTEDSAAIRWLTRAVAVKPDFADALLNLALQKHRENRTIEAKRLCRRAIASAPNQAEAHTLLGACLLAEGDLTQGFAEYEWRSRLSDFPTARNDLTQPAWTGGDLAGRTILIHDEQGLGDSIQFVRYAPLLRNLGAKVVVECQGALVRLFSTMAGLDAVIPRFAPAPSCDGRVALLSLPHLLGTAAATIPAAIPYLRAEPALVTKWKRRLGRRRGLNVGLVWAGNPEFKDDSRRSPGLAAMLPLLDVPFCRVFALQKGAGRRDLADWRHHLPASFTDLGEDLDDFADTAAIMTCLDLIISSCTAPPHLAGALGRPVWTILPFQADWRWGLTGDSTAWYPTMRLFRQNRPGDWSPVMGQVRAALVQAAKAKT